MLWVHGTLVDTGIAMHEAYLGPLDANRRAAFYREMSVVARVFGVPESVLPRTLVDFGEFRSCAPRRKRCPVDRRRRAHDPGDRA